MNIFLKFCLSCSVAIVFFTNTQVHAQLTVSGGSTSGALAAALNGGGVTIVSDSLICNNNANGTFTSLATPIALANGILLSTGRASAASGAESGLTSSGFGGAGDADLRSLLGTATTSFDACALILHVVPAGDTLRFRYQFGSEEYIQSTCGSFNDAFAFFISGPGISTTLPGVNMALVPGTTIPVAVNSINSGVPGSRGNIANCTAMGPGAPFTSYYIDNTGGSSIAYRGYTTVLTAEHAVNPCDTYRLKMVITDANNDIYDSGVFIEGGSLSSNTFSFSRVDALGNTINGLAHSIVKGCSPATVKVLAGHNVTAPTVLHYTESGTAIRGTDFTPLADSVIIPAGASEITFNVIAVATSTTGTRTLILHLLSPTSCGAPDSVTINIIDSPSASILTPDTAICGSSTALIRTTSSTGVVFSWTPATGLDNPAIPQPTASPAVATTYVMSAMLPGSGCAPILDSITISKDAHASYIISGDTTICPGKQMQFLVFGSDSSIYSWSPAAGLNLDSIQQPIAQPVATTTYIMTAIAAGGCISQDSITVTIADISASIQTPDTMICLGRSVQVITNTTTAGLSVQWLPTAGIAFPNTLNPIIIPDTSAKYYLYGSIAGCANYLDSIFIDVQPIPNVYIGGNRFICQFDTIHINASVNPAWYSSYQYHWYPATSLDDTTTPTVVFTAGSSGKYFVDVTSPAGCIGRDSAVLTVYSGDFAVAGPNQQVCPHDSVQFSITGGNTYAWHPTLYLSDSTSGSPWVKAITSQTYQVIATSAQGCRDTVSIRAEVWPAAVIYLDDSIRLYPGEQVHLQPQTNCTNVNWFPPQGLNNWQAADPIATPNVDTRYYVYGVTEHGCKVVDSIDIYMNPETIINIPNAFAPGTSEFGTFKIISLGSASLNHFRVYNRWGNVVFDTKDITKGWDGNYNGTPQPFGVYVYDIEAVTNTGKLVTKRGNVTLVR